MNILLVHPHDIHSPQEPWTIRIKKISAELAKKGHRVRLVYFPLDSRLAHKREVLDDKIELIALDRRLGVFSIFRNISRMTKIAKWADIIHFQKCYYYAVLPSLIAACLNNKPIHYDWDDWETKIFYYSNPKQKVVGEFLNIFERLIPEVVDTLSFSSKRIRELSLSRGALAENIFPAPVGADLEKFNSGQNYWGRIRKKHGISNQIVLYVGQLHGGQYAELFIQSARLITEKRQDVTFIIVGDGYRAHELKELVYNLDLARYFIFTGSVPHEEVPYYINDADVCVACFEDNDITRCKSPLKLVEYLACGKAIVASNVGEVRNIIGGVGLLTEPGNFQSLAEGISTLLNDKNLRERLSVQAKQRAERKYNWSITTDNILSAYHKALSSYKKWK